MPSEKQNFLNEGAMTHQRCLGVLGGQITRLYDDTIFGGCDTLKVMLWAVGKKIAFFNTFATA